jgi:RNA polymerase sigma-70 factor (ECF subfamily)
VQRLLARDQTALGALYDRYAGIVYALALRITGSTAEAEEVVVDTFWQVWQQADRYDRARGQLGAWIFTIARSRALDRLRARRRSPLTESDEQAEAAAAQRASAADNPERDLWRAEQSAIVRAALAELTAAQREVIELAYYHGLSHAEIAARLGEPLGTVKTRIRLGLAKMREKMGGLLTPVKGAGSDATSAS